MAAIESFSDSELRDEVDRRRKESKTAKRDVALGIARDMILTGAGFTCIHDRGEDHPLAWNPYCCGCPVSPIDGPPGNYEQRALICGRTTEYPQ